MLTDLNVAVSGEAYAAKSSSHGLLRRWKVRSVLAALVIRIDHFLGMLAVHVAHKAGVDDVIAEHTLDFV